MSNGSGQILYFFFAIAQLHSTERFLFHHLRHGVSISGAIFVYCTVTKPLASIFLVESAGKILMAKREKSKTEKLLKAKTMDQVTVRIGWPLSNHVVVKFSDAQLLICIQPDGDDFLIFFDATSM